MKNKHLFFLPLFVIFASCAKQTSDGAVLYVPKDSPEKKLSKSSSTEILWDEWGVPHIYAQNNNELFYSFGWAQMTSHANTILKLYANSRGRAAEYWGEKHLENDMMVNALNFPKIGRKWFNMQSPEFKGYIEQFAKGMNDYALKNPKAIEEKYKVVLPVENEDILKHALFVIYSRFVAGDNLGKVPQWEERGSNTYAVAPKRSASGNAMLVMNPHLPWFDEWLFYEGHFNTSDINTYGATLVGLPTLGIAFNEKLGWSHTNNTIDNADLYEINIKGGQYEVDGEWRDLIPRRAPMKIKQEDGSMVIKDLIFYDSPDHGPVMKQSEGKGITLKMPGFDRPYGIVQWWNMGKAQSLREFQSTLRRVQIPFFNIMYADQEGNIFYMFNGQVPKRATGDWDYWSGIIDGSKSENIWTEVHSYNELPKIENPESGWLQNANDPPWTSTFPRELNPEDFPPYMSPIRMNFRPQRSARMLVEDESITMEELEQYKLSTRIEMADRILDDLFVAIDEFGGEDAVAAKEVLMKWDRHADKDSRGMALFYNWARTINPFKASNYTEKWSIEKARTTPDGLADPEGAVKALEGVVQKFRESKTNLDVKWGDVYQIKYNNKNLPGNGVDGSVGAFRIAWSNGPQEDGKSYISGGDSWQSIIEFGDKVKARVLMSYGNSTQAGSKHFGDQLELFAKKEMRDCYFYREDVLQHVKKRETLSDGKF